MNEIKNKLHYNSETGLFTNIKNGNVVGSLNGNGYLEITYNKKRYYGHRLAWYFCYNIYPELQIDHINGVKTDNRISNLREVTNRENQSNTHKHRVGKLVGTNFNKLKKRWISHIRINKKLIHIGSHDTEQQAHEAYLKALINWKVLSNEL